MTGWSIDFEAFVVIKKQLFPTRKTWTVCALALTLMACREAPPPEPAEDGDSVFNTLSAAQQSLLANCNVNAAELTRLVALSHQSFDQDFDGGWRKIASRSECRLAAAIVIDQYILLAPALDPAYLSLLRWRAGQNLAEAGDYASALHYFLASRKAANNPSDAVWNLYVDSTVAFIKRERQALEAHFQALSAILVPEEEKTARRAFLEQNPNISMPDGFVDEPDNLPVVRRLLECFDAPYREAYRGDC